MPDLPSSDDSGVTSRPKKPESWDWVQIAGRSEFRFSRPERLPGSLSKRVFLPSPNLGLCERREQLVDLRLYPTDAWILLRALVPDEAIAKSGLLHDGTCTTDADFVRVCAKREDSRISCQCSIEEEMLTRSRGSHRNPSSGCPSRVRTSSPTSWLISALSYELRAPGLDATEMG